MKNIIDKLCKIANKLDETNLTEDANRIDKAIECIKQNKLAKCYIILSGSVSKHNYIKEIKHNIVKQFCFANKKIPWLQYATNAEFAARELSAISRSITNKINPKIIKLYKILYDNMKSIPGGLSPNIKNELEIINKLSLQKIDPITSQQIISSSNKIREYLTPELLIKLKEGEGIDFIQKDTIEEEKKSLKQNIIKNRIEEGIKYDVIAEELVQKKLFTDKKSALSYILSTPDAKKRDFVIQAIEELQLSGVSKEKIPSVLKKLELVDSVQIGQNIFNSTLNMPSGKNDHSIQETQITDVPHKKIEAEQPSTEKTQKYPLLVNNYTDICLVLEEATKNKELIDLTMPETTDELKERIPSIILNRVKKILYDDSVKQVSPISNQSNYRKEIHEILDEIFSLDESIKNVIPTWEAYVSILSDYSGDLIDKKIEERPSTPGTLQGLS